MLSFYESLVGFITIGRSNDPIRQYCQTEFKKDWKRKYYELTGKQL